MGDIYMAFLFLGTVLRRYHAARKPSYQSGIEISNSEGIKFFIDERAWVNIHRPYLPGLRYYDELASKVFRLVL